MKIEIFVNENICSVNDEVHILETSDNKSRLQWLQQLQSNRRRHYERENVDDILKVVSVELVLFVIINQYLYNEQDLKYQKRSRIYRRLCIVVDS